MMPTGQLSLGQSPRLSVPGRFFLTAPLFGVIAALVMLWAGPGAFQLRWSSGVLAATHLYTLGYMAMVMFGAAMQVFPVVVGHPFPRPLAVARVVHVLLSAGVLLMTVGFTHGPAWAVSAAGVMLILALLVFVGAAARALSGVSVWGATGRALSLALVALAITGALGFWLAVGYGGLAGFAFRWIDSHAAWGLLGWLPLLVMGVAFQVVPMFQVTPNYPRWLTRGLGFWVFAGLAVAVGLEHAPLPGWLSTLAFGLVALGLAGFALVTLRLQRQRRRRLTDVTVWYWRMGMVSLLLAGLLWSAGVVWNAISVDPRYAMGLGVLVILGFALSVINGMLYKIVPFLVWFHLTMGPSGQGAVSVSRAPNMKQIIPMKRAKRQFWLHASGLVAVLLGVLGLPFGWTAGAILLGLASGFLEYDVLRAFRLYRTICQAGSEEQGVERAMNGAT